MKEIYLITIALIVSFQCNSQVYLWITKTNGELVYGEYAGKQNNKIVLQRKKEEIRLSLDSIDKVQTTGVHFQNDSYTNELSQNAKILEFDNLGSFGGWGIYISARTNGINTILLFKFKWKIHNDKVPTWNVVNDNEEILLNLSNGKRVNIALTNAYILEGYETYNFGYTILDNTLIKELTDSPIENFLYRETECKAADTYVIMRQLLAIFDENLQWLKW